MKKFFAFIAAMFVSAGSFAQSVSITVVASGDGSTFSTNAIQVPQARVQGLLLLWNRDCNVKTNAFPPIQALSFGEFVVQEIRDRGAEYAKAFAAVEMKAWGITNPPVRLIEAWPTLTLEQRTNAAVYHKFVGN